MTVPAKQHPSQETAQGQLGSLESVLVKGDLSKLTEAQRLEYVSRICASLGLNPLTRPFEFIQLGGKLVLYAKRDCADQLRKINGISVEIVSQDVSDDILAVHVRAKDAEGRTDEDLGAVPYPPTLKGEARANALLKAITKAKRRVTLSISGLGFLDESEVDSIPNTRPRQDAPIDHNPETGEVIEEQPFNWIQWGQETIAAATNNPSLTVDKTMLDRMRAEAPKVHDRLVKALDRLKPKSQPMPNDNPEAYLDWLREQCAAIDDQEAFEAFQAKQNEVLKVAFPPDAQQAAGIMAAKQRELADR